MKRRIGLLLGIVLGCCAAPFAEAACTLSFTSLNFGTYTGTLLTGVNQATVNCTTGSPYTLGLNAGTGSGATTTTRKMTGGSGTTLSYQIFQDSSRTKNWGNTSGVDTVAGTGTGANQVLNIYSQVLSGQLVQPGTYTDTISSSTMSFTVTAVVQASCNFSANSLAFGNYTGVVLNATSNLTIQCTNTTTYTVGLNAGTSTGATVTSRMLTGPGSSHLGYSLFSDSGRTLNWGLTSNTVAGTGSGASQALTVYGQIPAGRSVTPGTYSDSITATITY